MRAGVLSIALLAAPVATAAAASANLQTGFCSTDTHTVWTIHMSNPNGTGDATLTNTGTACSTTGAAGPAGPAGAKGDTGDKGATGAQGPAGAKGDAGVAGNVGPVGPPGVAGPAGPVGPSGAAGTSGAQGLPGVQGPAGSNGAKGDTGAVGAKGDKGDTGSQGAPGAPGTIGAQGPQGIPGVQGHAGQNSVVTAASVDGGTQLFVTIDGITSPIGPVITNGSNGSNGSDGSDGTNGTNGVSPVITTSIVPVGDATYPNGALAVTVTVGESSTTVYVSNGLDGARGLTGHDGANGKNGKTTIVTQDSSGNVISTNDVSNLPKTGASNWDWAMGLVAGGLILGGGGCVLLYRRWFSGITL